MPSHSAGNAPQLRVIRAIAQFCHKPLLPEDTYQQTGTGFPNPPPGIHDEIRKFPKFFELSQLIIKTALDFNPPARREDLRHTSEQLNAEAHQANEAIKWAATMMQAIASNNSNDPEIVAKGIASGRMLLRDSEENHLKKLSGDEKNGKKGEFATIAVFLRVKSNLMRNLIPFIEQQNPADARKLMGVYAAMLGIGSLPEASQKKMIAQAMDNSCNQVDFAANCFSILQHEYDRAVGAALSANRAR